MQQNAPSVVNTSQPAAAPTAGEARKEHSESLLSRFSQILAQSSNPVSMWLLPGGTGKYRYDADTIQTNSHLQFQDNPILHASIAQMMIEIDNIDKVLGKTTTIASNAQSIVATVNEQTTARLEATFSEAAKTQPVVGELALQVAEQAQRGSPESAIGAILNDAKKQGILNASVSEKQDDSIGIGLEATDSSIKAGFEKEPQEKGGALKFKGNCKEQPQPQLSHDQPDPIIRAFSFLAEMLLILMMNAANIRTEVTFNVIAQMYQQRIHELVKTSPEQAADYLNKTLFTKGALDPAIQKALISALGLDGVVKIDATLLSAPAEGLAYNRQLCQGATAEHVNNVARREHFKAGGEGPVEFRLVGSEEQLDAVKKMNTYSAPKLETGLESTQMKASLTQAEPLVPKNEARSSMSV